MKLYQLEIILFKLFLVNYKVYQGSGGSSSATRSTASGRSGAGYGEYSARTQTVGNATKIVLGSDANCVILIGQLTAARSVVIERTYRPRDAREVLQAAVVSFRSTHTIFN